MKKYLILFLFVFMFLSPNFVKAEDYNSCYDDFLVGNVSFQYHSTYWMYIQPNIPVKSNTTYYLRFFISEDFISSDDTRFASTPKAYDKDLNSLGSISITNYSWDSDFHIFSFTTPVKEELAYLKLLVYTFNTNYTILENSSFILSDNKEDLIECPVIEGPVDPVDPNNPTVQETDQAKILQNFYTLFLDRLKFISGYAISNYLFLAFIGIILVFVILEIFLYLYNRGGYK